MSALASWVPSAWMVTRVVSPEIEHAGYCGLVLVITCFVHVGHRRFAEIVGLAHAGLYVVDCDLAIVSRRCYIAAY